VLARERALRIALAEARQGVRETGEDTSKRIKDYQSADSTVPNPDTGYFWCASFIVWCYREARRELTETGRSASVPDTKKAARKADWIVRKPKRGDIVCFQFAPIDPTPDHIGLVLEVLPDGSIRSVEGNTDSPVGGADGVFVKTRARSLCEVFIRVPGSVPTGMGRGDHGEAVRKLQRRLVRLGHRRLAVDGEFGEKTEKAVETFQRRSGLPETGVATTKTLQAIERALAPEPEPEPEPPPPVERRTPKPTFEVKATFHAGEPQEAAVLTSRTAMHRQVNVFLDDGAKNVRITPSSS
jgi:hypothetical protein